MLEKDRHEINYLRLAAARAEASYAKKMKVGAIIVKDHQVISDGYNGTPSGFPNVCETPGKIKPNGKLETKPEVLHAEANAILKLACSNFSSEGATLYLTVPPCIECAKLIIQAKIKRVVYANKHKEDGLDLLKKARVETRYLSALR